MRDAQALLSPVLYNGELVGKLYFVSERINALQQTILLHGGIFCLELNYSCTVIICVSLRNINAASVCFAD